MQLVYAQSLDWILTVNPVNVNFGDSGIHISIKGPFSYTNSDYIPNSQSVGYFVVSDKLNTTKAKACIQIGYQNWYNCDGQTIDANSYYTNTKILADLGPTYDDIRVHDACLTYHHLKEGTDEFNECEKALG